MLVKAWGNKGPELIQQVGHRDGRRKGKSKLERHKERAVRLC